MINKEIILGNGNIVKDFSDRSIPQNSHNQVCVSFLIPSNQFNDYDDYSVFTAVSRVVGNVETPLNALVLTASKSITIDGINYIKFSCVLSLDYTNVIGELRFSPYIQATIHTDSVLDDSDNDNVDEVITETLLNQNSYTNCKLNIIKAVRIQEDASLEDASTATTLAGQINSKKIYYNAEWNSIAVGQENTLYYNIATSYNPSVALYNGSIVAIKNQNVVSYYFPYLNDSAVELLKMTNDGLFYKISGISRTGEGTEQSPYVYNATKQKLTYTKSEVDTALNLKVDKTTTINDKPLSSDITITKGDVGLGNVVNYGVESTPTSSGSDLYITSKGVYDYCQAIYNALNGYATTGDLSAINTRLEAVESVIGDGTDDDSVINTLYEVIQVLNGLGEGANLLDLINAKANQSDLTALSGVVNAMGLKVDFLYDSNANAYAEIKAQSGTIDILTTDWETNTGDANYPYKWELSNGYLVGASYVSVVFDKDSDTSMLSATVGIDEENGKVIIYASDTPIETISIEKIAVFNNVNAYINYSQTIVSQVNTNTSAISDINNVKLPQYVKLYNTQTTTISVVGADYSNHLIELGTNAVILENMYKESSTINKVSNITLQNGKAKIINSTWESGSKTAEHTLEFDEDGNLTLDGNAVGGGSTLYQHNMELQISKSGFKMIGNITFYSATKNTAYQINSESDKIAFLSDLASNVITNLEPTQAPIYDGNGTIIGFVCRVEYYNNGGTNELKIIYTNNGDSTTYQSFNYIALTILQDNVITL